MERACLSVQNTLADYYLRVASGKNVKLISDETSMITRRKHTDKYLKYK